MATQIAWIYLLIAGLLEIVWATGLKSTQSFTKFWPSLGILAVMVASFYCLSQALKGLPVGTAYAVWTGIGASGTALLGVFLFGEPAHFLRIFCIFLILAGTVGLKLFH